MNEKLSLAMTVCCAAPSSFRCVHLAPHAPATVTDAFHISAFILCNSVHYYIARDCSVVSYKDLGTLGHLKTGVFI